MITFTQLGSHGRLGNQLFQYAAMKSISLETGYELKIPNIHEASWQNQKCQLANFNIKCDILTGKDLENIRYLFREQDHTRFFREAFECPDNTNFLGYFQNYNYFSKYEKQIREEFVLNEELEDYSENYISKVRQGNEGIVSIHLRRGDITDGTYGDTYSEFYGESGTFDKDSVFGRYLAKGLGFFHEKDVKFLVFTGGTRQGTEHNQSDVNWCKENLKDFDFNYCEGNTDMQDFAIMKKCDHHICSHMTSFGYWAAFLNNNPEKKVIAPKSYTVPDDGRTSRGFYPPKWITL